MLCIVAVPESEPPGPGRHEARPDVPKPLRIPCLAAVRIQRLSMIVYKCLQTAPDCLLAGFDVDCPCTASYVARVILAGLRRVLITDRARPEVPRLQALARTA